MIEAEELKKKLDTSVFEVIKELIDLTFDNIRAINEHERKLKSEAPNLERMIKLSAEKCKLSGEQIARLGYLEAKVKELKELASRYDGEAGFFLIDKIEEI